MSAQGRKRKRPEVIEGAILAANLAKDAAETISVLAPLKASMGMLTTLLESIKVGHSLNRLCFYGVLIVVYIRRLGRTRTIGKY
jgi:hypothetical protein